MFYYKKYNIFWLLLRIISFILVFILIGFKFTKAEQTYVVGLDATFVPMGYLDSDGKTIVGVDKEISDLVAKKLNCRFIFQPINWSAKELELSSKKIDMIWNGLSYTKERQETMLLSKSYMQNAQVVVVRKDSNINDLKDLANLTISAQKDSTGYEALKKHEIFASLKGVIQLEDMFDCLTEVKQKKCDACVVDEVIFKYMAKTKGLDKDFKILDVPLSKEDYVIAFRKQDHELKNKIEKALEELVLEKKTDKISEKYFGENIICLREIKENKADVNKENLNYSDMLKELLNGFLVSLKLFVVVLLFSLPLGILICFLKVKKIKILSLLIDCYINLMRGTPLLLQIFFAFYGLPILFPNFFIKSRFLIGFLTFSLNYAAYFAEILKGAYNSIDVGQFDSIKVLNINKLKATFKIVLPQMFSICLPSICNETITLIKDTALIFSIGVIELLTTAKNLVNKTISITPYIFATILYLLVGLIINIIFKLIEKKLKF